MKMFEINDFNLPFVKEFSEHLPCGFIIFMADANENIIFFNHTIVQYFGCDSNEEFIKQTGNSFKGIVYNDDYEEIKAFIQMHINENNFEQCDTNCRFVRHDGNIGLMRYHIHFGNLSQYGNIFYVFAEDFSEHQYLLDSQSNSNKNNKKSSKQNQTKNNRTLEGTNILLVDDDDLTREINKEILELEGATVVEADTGIQAIKLYRNNSNFDAIIMDVMMPIMDGITATREIRFIEKSTNNHVPIVILTADVSESLIDDGINAGANGFLNKPLVVSELSRILLNCMREYSEIIKEKLADTIRIANTDALTSVKNIAAYTDKVAEISEKMRVFGANLEYAVVMCDINNLKTVNDDFGHDIGDVYIKNSCKIICDIFEHSPVYRIGGDEFVVILQNKDYNNREKLISKMNDVIAETAKIEDFKLGKADLAFGIALYDPSLDFSFSDVVKRADVAMYKNKNSCKNRRK